MAVGFRVTMFGVGSGSRLWDNLAATGLHGCWVAGLPEVGLIAGLLLRNLN